MILASTPIGSWVWWTHNECEPRACRLEKYARPGHFFVELNGKLRKVNLFDLYQTKEQAEAVHTKYVHAKQEEMMP